MVITHYVHKVKLHSRHISPTVSSLVCTQAPGYIRGYISPTVCIPCKPLLHIVAQGLCVKTLAVENRTEERFEVRLPKIALKNKAVKLTVRESAVLKMVIVMVSSDEASPD